jgi:transcriptional regulator with XRE-family HTH domain
MTTFNYVEVIELALRRDSVAAMKTGFGSMLSEWRATRRLSQLDLALLTGVSQRHISFVESGRAQPSRDIVFKLADGLDLPLRARNDIFLAAGYAPAYPERHLDLTEMKAARDALELILTHHEPYPAIVMDANWNIVMQNGGSTRIIACCLDGGAIRALSPDGQLNFMQLMFSTNGLRPNIMNWAQTRAALLNRLRRESAGDPNSISGKLRQEFDGDICDSGDVVFQKRTGASAASARVGRGRHANPTVQYLHDIRNAARRHVTGIAYRHVLSGRRSDPAFF